jgi:hypothetical protein
MNWSNQETASAFEMLDDLSLNINPAQIAFRCVRLWSNEYGVADCFMPHVITAARVELAHDTHEAIMRRTKVSPSGCLNEFARAALKRAVDSIDWHQLAVHYVGEAVKELKSAGFKQRHPYVSAQ